MALLSFSGFDPLDSLLRLQAELDRRLGSPGAGFELGPAGSANVFPPVNVFRDEHGGLVIRAEVSGVKPDELAIEVERGRLTMTGERGPTQAGKGAFHRRERQAGKFSRVVQLPDDLEAGHAHAQVRNGVLTVRIPKSEAAKPRTITVQQG
jgi:HSP20 family protein